ncbi:MAG: CHAD domain-containing protein [Coriobacteriia bacterium]|nr:CHAD domain-containing protein [Coriobacteriia bacterium]
MNRRFVVPDVDASTPLADAASALLLSKAEPLFVLEADARGGADADAVHDMRVASRRLREAMRLLGPVYPRREFRAWYKRVRRITRALGPVRDSDVFIDEFSKLAGALGEGGRRAIAFTVGYRAGQRGHELELLNRELAGLDLERSRRSFERMAGSLGDSPEGRSPLSAFAHVAVAERAAAVFGEQPAALREENYLQQHSLRIGYKRLRYAVEVLAPCYGESFDLVHDILTDFQDALGELHDVHVFLEVLRSPDHRTVAGLAGVSSSDFGEVEALLEARARAGFLRFAQLAAAHPPQDLLPQLLLPLTQRPEPAPEIGVEARCEPVESGESEIPSPVIVGDEPWAEGWEELEVVTDAGPEFVEDV